MGGGHPGRLNMRTIFLKPTSIGFRLLAFLLAGGLFPLAILGGIFFHFAQRELRSQLARELSVGMESFRNALDVEMMETYLSLQHLSRHPGLRANPRGTFREFLRTSSGRSKALDRDSVRCMAVTDSHGVPQSQLGDCYHLSKRRQVCLAMAKAGQRVSSPYMLYAGDPSIDMFFPIHERDSINLSGLWITVDLEHLSDMLAATHFAGGVNKDAFIFTSDQLMIARISPGRGFLSNVAAGYPVVTAALQERESTALGEVTGGSQSIAAAAPLTALISDLEPLRNWRVAIVQPLDDPSEPTVILIERLRFGAKVSVLLAIGCSLLFSLTLLRGILSPVRQLTAATLRVRNGDLSTPIHVEGVEEISQLGAVFNEMREQLKGLMGRLTEIATTDQLTGLANRRAFDARLEDEIRRARRYNQPFSLAIMDLDHFKSVNDIYGHVVGDRVLQETARVCRLNCRDTDLMARYGGEEFAFILPQTGPGECQAIMERVRLSVESALIEDDFSGGRIRITASIGTSSFPEIQGDAESILVDADEALYRAKNEGRNRVFAA